MNLRTACFMFLAIALVTFASQPALAQGGPGPSSMPQLKFFSQPPQYGRVGSPYVYTARARSMDSSATIRYFAPPVENPPGFAIDSVSGVVTWTPTVRGFFPISLIARSNRGEYGIQRFTVTVGAGSAVIGGKVTDTAGVGIPNVVIEVLQAGNVDPALAGCYGYVGKTNALGNYLITNVTPGQYKLHAISPTPQFASQWYDGKDSARLADVVTVVDSPATRADFVLRGGVTQLRPVLVTGSVKDTLGQPLPTAKVFFVRAGFLLNSNESVEDFRRMFDENGVALDFRMEGVSPHVFRAVVDSVGNYKVKVPPGMYIAFARALGYSVEFYFEQPSILTAARLPLRNDTTGINFTLAPRPLVPLGSISGTVMDTALGVGVRSRILAIRDRWIAPAVVAPIRTYVTDTDSLGAYTVDELLPGWYFVLALPVGSYAPAFYSNDSLATRWHHATRVWVSGNAVTGIDIYVRQIPAPLRGYAAIRGRLRLNGTVMPPPPGVFVYAFRNGAVAGYGITDGSGQFMINGIAPGTYAVSADVPGYDLLATQSASVSYLPSGEPVSADVDITISSTTDVEDAGSSQPVSFSLSQNYPNPFNPTTGIRYQVPGISGQGTGTSVVDLRVYDLLGREVAVLVNGVQNAGTYTVTFDASRLTSGVYFYQLKAGNLSATRKMILMK